MLLVIALASAQTAIFFGESCLRPSAVRIQAYAEYLVLLDAD